MRLLSLILTAWALVFAANGVENNTELGPSKIFLKNYCVSCPVSYTHLTLPTTPYV